MLNQGPLCAHIECRVEPTDLFTVSRMMDRLKANLYFCFDYVNVV